MNDLLDALPRVPGRDSISAQRESKERTLYISLPVHVAIVSVAGVHIPAGHVAV